MYVHAVLNISQAKCPLYTLMGFRAGAVSSERGKPVDSTRLYSLVCATFPAQFSILLHFFPRELAVGTYAG
jgi:hypothetical protein